MRIVISPSKTLKCDGHSYPEHPILLKRHGLLQKDEK
jgi:hypothetical protein